MKITKISASSSRTFNHPFERYSNFRFELTLNAELADGEDPLKATVALQEQVEIAAENHKQRILTDVSTLNEIEQLQLQLLHSEEAEKEEINRQLAPLLSKPLFLPHKQIHPGHPQHPGTGW